MILTIPLGNDLESPNKTNGNQTGTRYLIRAYILWVIGAVGVQSWQKLPKVVCRLGCLWALKMCKETISRANEGKHDPGSPFPRIFLKYLTKPNSTQVLAISARSEQYGLFLTPIISTNNFWGVYQFPVQRGLTSTFLLSSYNKYFVWQVWHQCVKLITCPSSILSITTDYCVYRS